MGNAMLGPNTDWPESSKGRIWIGAALAGAAGAAAIAVCIFALRGWLDSKEPGKQEPRRYTIELLGKPAGLFPAPGTEKPLRFASKEELERFRGELVGKKLGELDAILGEATYSRVYRVTADTQKEADRKISELVREAQAGEVEEQARVYTVAEPEKGTLEVEIEDGRVSCTEWIVSFFGRGWQRRKRDAEQ